MTLGTDPSYRRPPVPGAFDRVVERGARLRRRRLAVGGGAGATLTVSVLVAALALTGGGPADSLRQLPADRPPATDESPVATDAPATPEPSSSAPGVLAPTPATTGTGAPTSAPSPAGGEPGAPDDPAGGRQPWHKQVLRAHSGTAAGSVCQYPASSGDPYNHGWCVRPYGTGEVAGAGLATVGVELCRQTAGVASSGTLSFPTSQELEVVISREGKSLWTWSATQDLPAQAHTFTVDQGQCFAWTTTWNGSTSDGTLLADGVYDVTASVVAPDQGNLSSASTAEVRR